MIGVARFLLLCVCLGTLWDHPQQPTFRAGTDVVNVDVSVHIRNSPVMGLTSRDFSLFDNTVAQRIEVSVVETVPIDVTLEFDLNEFSQSVIGNRFASDLAEIAGMLRPVDRLRVIAFAADVRELVPMEAPSALLRRGEFVGAGSPVEAFTARVGRSKESGFDLRHDPQFSGLSLFDALFVALAKPSDVGRRHLIVCFSLAASRDGAILDGDAVVRLAERSDGLLHVGFYNQSARQDSDPGLYARIAVTAAAKATGGEVHDVRNMVGAFKSIFSEFKESYVLTYTLTGVPAAGWHGISVKIPAHPEYAVRARSGYMGR